MKKKKIANTTLAVAPYNCCIGLTLEEDNLIFYLQKFKSL